MYGKVLQEKENVKNKNITGKRNNLKFDRDLANRINKEYDELYSKEQVQENRQLPLEHKLLIASENYVYAVDKQETFVIAERPEEVLALACLAGCIVHDAGPYGIRNTMTNANEYGVTGVYALAVVPGNWLFSTLHEIYKKHSNPEDMPDVPVLLTETADFVDALAIGNKNWYYASSHGERYLIRGGENLVASRPTGVYCLGVHNETLYDGFAGGVFETVSGKLVAERKGNVRALVSCNGVLYDAGNYGCVFNTLDDPKGEHPIINFGKPIAAMTAVSNSIWKNSVWKTIVEHKK
jgi:hypothetical protein